MHKSNLQCNVMINSKKLHVMQEDVSLLLTRTFYAAPFIFREGAA